MAQPYGKVYLVGAGPGDPGLITARGLELLRVAQVVAYDALVDPRLLRQAPEGAELIDVGKRAKAHKMTQEQIQELLVEKARQGVTVVRLKGGDPYLFGRGAEEAAYLAQNGVECEVVPGVTAGIAAAATAGIPVTHRKLASTVTFVTGHEDPTKQATAIDYQSLAGLVAAGGTVCFYMGVGRVGVIGQALESHGLSGDTPTAVVQWGTTPRQRSVRTRLDRAEEDVRAAGLEAPALIIVGAVAGITEPGLDFFTRRPLFGKQVVITRTRQQASELRELLDELGAVTLEAPTIELAEPSPEIWALVDQAIRGLDHYDWLVLTSVNGVAALAQRLEFLGLDSRHLAGGGRLKIAAIGDATAQALDEKFKVKADLIPTQFVAESLAAELIAQGDVQGKQFLLLRADIARPALPHLLKQAGGKVTELTVYETRHAPDLPTEVWQALREHKVDWITFTSSSTAMNMVELLGDQWPLLKEVRIASIGPITSKTLRELGVEPTVEAPISTIAGLVEAMVAAQSVGADSR